MSNEEPYEGEKRDGEEEEEGNGEGEVEGAGSNELYCIRESYIFFLNSVHIIMTFSW